MPLKQLTALFSSTPCFWSFIFSILLRPSIYKARNQVHDSPNGRFSGQGLGDESWTMSKGDFLTRTRTRNMHAHCRANWGVNFGLTPLLRGNGSIRVNSWLARCGVAGASLLIATFTTLRWDNTISPSWSAMVEWGSVKNCRYTKSVKQNAQNF